MSVSAAEGLSYMASGDPRRPAVLFLHGFMGSSADWDEIIATLEDRFYCVAADLPGHGASLSLPDEAYTIKGTARRILDVLGELGIGRTALVGYSMGGRLALYLALRHPARCVGLFLESASPGLESAEERRSRRETDERRALRLETEDFEEFLCDWYRQLLFASLARDEALLARTIQSRRRNDPGELARSLRDMGTGNQPSLWGDLPGLQVPARAVAGELDEKYVEVSRLMANLSPLLKSVVVPGVGHNVHVEAPEVYLALLKSSLETL